MDNQLPEQQVEEVAAEQEQQEEFDAEKAVEQFDVTRKTRIEALEQVEKLLNRAAAGWNMDKKEQIKCFRNLYVLCLMQDMLLRGLMSDLVGIIRSMAKGEVDQFNLTAKVFTITQALYSKNLVTHEEMEKIHQEITVPQLMARLQETKEEDEKEEDVEG